MLPSSIETYGASLLSGFNSFSYYDQELKYLFDNELDSVPTSLDTIIYAEGSGNNINLTMWSTDKVSNAPITLYLASDTDTVTWGILKYAIYLESVVIPDGIKTLGVDTFSGCSGLKSVVLPDGFTAIPTLNGR